jgi:hypothetical protein
MANSVETVVIPRFNWKALDDTFTKLAHAIDSNMPVEGAGIRLTFNGVNGVEIARADMAHDSNGSQQESPPIGATPIRLYDVSFFAAQVVDPSTCKATFVQVLIQDPGGWADFNAYIGAGAPDKWPG